MGCGAPVDGAEAPGLASYEQIRATIESEDPQRWDVAAGLLRQLLTAPAFATSAGSPAVPEPKNGRVFRDWWERGGSTWVVRRLGADGSALHFPPTVRPLAEEVAVPQIAVCDTPPCGRTAEFLARVETDELLLQGYRRSRTYTTRWSKTDRAGGRMNAVQAACRADELRAWTDCVASARSVRFVFPIGDFRMPSEGWLFLSRAGLEDDGDCREAIAVNLGSGEAKWSRGCESRTGRTDPEAFREVALLVLLAGLTGPVSDGQVVAVPRHLARPKGCSQESAPPVVRIGNSHHVQRRYWLWVGGEVAASGMLSPGDYAEPVADVVEAALTRLSARLVPSSRPVRLPNIGATNDDAVTHLIGGRPIASGF